MVTESEKQIVEKYMREGWRVLRGGAPDFLMLKVNEQGEIEDILFVEVKYKGRKLTYEQQVYRKVLEKLGAPYKVEHVKVLPAQANSIHPSPAQPNPSHLKPIQPKPSHSKPTQSDSTRANFGGGEKT
jgi:hypothetical protein